MSTYKVLNNQKFSNREYSIIPIRYEDRMAILKWRNEQIYHLRQIKPLTTESQNKYFDETISDLFDQKLPKQLLFSFLKNKECIGYGGLVHINWTDKNAEISFIMNTHHEKESFVSNWSNFLNCLEQLAFKELNFHKIFVYAFDIRPKLYKALEAHGYFLDARLKDHCFVEGEFKEVVIYSKLINQ